MLSANLAVGFAAGMLLHLLLVVLVAARPAPRRLDRLFFFLFGALFLWHTGTLLALTLEPFQGEHRAVLVTLARVLAFVGLAALSPLLVDVHAEYAQAAWRRWVWLFYLPLVAAPFGIWAAAVAPGIPRGPWTTGFILYFSSALLISGMVNLGQAKRALGNLRVFHGALAIVFSVLAAASIYVFLLARGTPALESFQYLLMLSSIVPSALVGYWMFRFNFLEAAAQRGVALGALGLLGLLAYALGIERLAGALERAGYVPSGVTEAVLIFFLVVLVEPVSRRVRRWMSGQVSAELARLEEIHLELLGRALLVPPEEARAFAEERITRFFGFPVRVSPDGELHPEAGRELKFRELGSLRVLAAHTAETLERARLLGERLRLEREMAEREKMAALGEMVAFIAHRLKNPLSAIHTLVQVISEQSPEAAEHCDVIRGEVRRLNTAVEDLLRFTRPGPAAPARPVKPAEPILARPVVEEAVALFAADAEQKHVALECRADPAARLPIRREALHDVLTSLLGNALEAAPPGSRVLVSCETVDSSAAPNANPKSEIRNPKCVVLSVEDAGPGVAQEYREKIFEPFFTLKPGGTGLGLALARRRAQEAGAEIHCVSPARDGRGARFEVIFRN